MLFYFFIGTVSGAILIGVFNFSKLMQYRSEVLLMKKTIKRLETLNADLQYKVNYKTRDKEAYSKAIVLSM